MVSFWNAWTVVECASIVPTEIPLNILPFCILAGNGLDTSTLWQYPFGVAEGSFRVPYSYKCLWKQILTLKLFLFPFLTITLDIDASIVETFRSKTITCLTIDIEQTDQKSAWFSMLQHLKSDTNKELGGGLLRMLFWYLFWQNRRISRNVIGWLVKLCILIGTENNTDARPQVKEN